MASGLGARGSGLAAARLKPSRYGRGLTLSRYREKIVFAVFAAFAFLTPGHAQQPDRARTEALARRATERLQSLQREADRLAAEERSLLNDVKKLEIDRQIRAEELKRVDADAAKVQADLDATGARAAALERTSRDEAPQLRARLVEIYKLGEARYLRLLLSTPDLRRIGQSTRTVAALAKLDRERIASHARTLDELKRERRTLEDRQAQLAALRGAAEKAGIAAQRAAQAKSALIRDIDSRRDMNAQLAGELQGAQQKVQAALRDLTAGGAAAGEPSLPLKPFRGDLEWPVAGTVARRFGRGPTANGMEIAAAEGAEARAIHEGTVAFAGPFSGFGNLVILDHGSQAFSLYGDLLDIGVKKGDRVEHGRRVGTVGATSSGGSGLYFELRVDGQPVDPLQWLRKR
ncbi:MAG TPA: peptidoglycan DD-metalloendopeptidase family protein [Vicinamibacterales bacterium]|nr:peptidoglycan DD-metalloendopeptidase family protein [Vicinamibacterales bacterium]